VTLTFRAERADEGVMATLVALEYPNGRTHDTALHDTVEPGAVFDLYGRQWKVIGPVRFPRDRRRQVARDPRLLCRQADPLA
jgi:hypothetical protein